MFNENLKALRQKKGFTQEMLAIQVHVVRQTVSKWEKGLSVPDADTLQKIAEVLEVSVSQLLGADAPDETKGRNEIAEQLARINEQLAIKNRRARRIWKAVGVLIIVPMVLFMVLAFYNVPCFGNKTAGKTEWSCTLAGERYVYGIEYDSNYRILVAGGDAYIADHIDLDGYDANQVAAHIADYFENKGGSVIVTATEGLPLSE